MANEKRLIDANAAISKLEDELFMCKPVSMDDGYLEEYKKRVIPKLLRNVIDWIKNQPTVDAVEVVRCKDCKHYDKDALWCNINSPMFSEEHYNWYEDDYCSCGERRTDEA